MSRSDPHSPPVIVLENLVKFFGRFAALRGISDSFAPGRLYVVLGDNGAGKSTLVRVVAGLMEPSQGSCTLLGAKKVREVAHRVGYMGHAPLLYDELSGMDNLRYFAPSRVQLPWLGSISPATTRNSVLFPAPLSPSTTYRRPGTKLAETPRRAANLPKNFTRFSRTMTGGE